MQLGLRITVNKTQAQHALELLRDAVGSDGEDSDGGYGGRGGDGGGSGGGDNEDMMDEDEYGGEERLEEEYA
jgi:hypothetical protein